MAKITPSKRGKSERETVSVKTKKDSHPGNFGYKWWNASTKEELALQVCSTASFLKERQQYRYRQAAIYSRLYGNLPLFNFAGANFNRMGLTNNLPLDRPTMNVVQSCIDTIVARITQGRPRPVFLTDNGDYKQRNFAKQMNQFISGELFRCKAYDLGPLLLRDASVLGTGALKFFEGQDKKVQMERVLETELLVDPNDALYGSPRQMFHVKLVDRGMLMESFPKYSSVIERAEQAYPDNSDDSQRSVADQVMAVESWHLPSGEDASDGIHAIATTSGLIFEEKWEKEKFPFAFLASSPRMLGFWGQGTAERLMGTQVEINKLLMTISKSINLVGVPRVFVEDGSKVVKAHHNNDIGAIVTYKGTKPIYEVAPCMPAEVYDQLQRLITYAYQQEGVSSMAAQAGKPAGLNSGEAIRNYDDLQSDRFAALEKRYDKIFIEMAYQIIEMAAGIAERDGKYSTVYPNKDGTREVDLPSASLLKNPYIIQCFDASSLPRDPAGRLQKITEMIQSGMIDIQEGRRLLDFPDLQQSEKLANALEERILQILDKIVEKGDYTAPDPYIDLDLATKLTVQYINLYGAAKLEEEKQQLLRDFFAAVQTLKRAAMPPQMPAQGAAPLAVPEAPPTSPLLPNAPQ